MADSAENAVSRQLTASFFAKSRSKLEDLLGESYLALLAAGRPPRRTADEDYAFFANRNFFYLCGIEQQNAVLLLYKQHEERRDVLFMPAPDRIQERWTGRRMSREEAGARSGIAEISFLDGLDGILGDLLARQPGVRIWLDHSAENAQADDLRTRAAALSPESEPADLSALMAQLRMIKEPEEISMMEEAIAMTGRGIASMIRMTRPGIMEYHLWDAFRSSLAREGCLEPAFPSIVAAGGNIFCLHYANPAGPVHDGDLVQIDVGAMFGGLCADISRAFPANGRFSPRQLAVYQVVRACQEAAFASIKPGAVIKDINEKCRETAQEGLAAIGALGPDDNIGEFFWHGVSHQLGMDVHDVSGKDIFLKEGMVLTVEPGVYVESWGVGLRIEDDVLVTADGCRNLSLAIPREADEIEAMFTGGAENGS